MRKAPLIIALLFVVLMGYVFSGMVFRPSDRVLIRESLDDAIAAAASGDASPVYGIIVNDETPSNADIRKFVQQAKPQVEVLEFEPQIDGTEATLVAPFQVKAAMMMFQIDQVIPDVHVSFRRTYTFKSFRITPRWEIVEVRSTAVPALDGI